MPFTSVSILHICGGCLSYFYCTENIDLTNLVLVLVILLAHLSTNMFNIISIIRYTDTLNNGYFTISGGSRVVWSYIRRQTNYKQNITVTICDYWSSIDLYYTDTIVPIILIAFLVLFLLFLYGTTYSTCCTGL